MKNYSQNVTSAGRALASTFALVVVLVLSTGCPSGKQDASGSARSRIVIKGSNTIGEELGPRLAEEYKKEHPEVDVLMEAKGTGSGFWGLIAGVCDIAAASRPMIKDEEQQARVRGLEFADYVIGSYGVAVVVNKDNPVSNLTKEQVRDIFIGSIQNWKEVGGQEGPIRLYIRDPISGTYLGFRELALEDQPYATNALTEFKSYQEIAAAVAKDPHAIGYTSFQLATHERVKGLTIDGFGPGAEFVNQGKYPFGRQLHFFTNKAKEDATVRSFIEFVRSDRGQAILDQLGYARKP